MKSLLAMALIAATTFPATVMASTCAEPSSSKVLTQSAPAEELHWRANTPVGACLAARSKTVNSAAAGTPAPAASKPAQSGGSYRFNMSQNGKRMSADEFDAWMKANGIRIAGSNGPVKEEKPAEPEPTSKKKKKK